MARRRYRGVYRGFRTDPKADYYANSGTKAPSMLIELGFVSCPQDNEFFAERYKDACREIVKASCKFLGVEYKEPTLPAGPDKPSAPDDSSDREALRQRIAELEQELDTEREARRGAEQWADNAESIIRGIVTLANKL